MRTCFQLALASLIVVVSKSEELPQALGKLQCEFAKYFVSFAIPIHGLAQAFTTGDLGTAYPASFKDIGCKRSHHMF